jgi:hypothetical protein
MLPAPHVKCHCFVQKVPISAKGDSNKALVKVVPWHVAARGRLSSKRKTDCPRKRIASAATKSPQKPHKTKSDVAAIAARDGPRACDSIATFIISLQPLEGVP